MIRSGRRSAAGNASPRPARSALLLDLSATGFIQREHDDGRRRTGTRARARCHFRRRRMLRCARIRPARARRRGDGGRLRGIAGTARRDARGGGGAAEPAGRGDPGARRSRPATPGSRSCSRRRRPAGREPRLARRQHHARLPRRNTPVHAGHVGALGLAGPVGGGRPGPHRLVGGRRRGSRVPASRCSSGPAATRSIRCTAPPARPRSGAGSACAWAAAARWPPRCLPVRATGAPSSRFPAAPRRAGRHCR